MPPKKKSSPEQKSALFASPEKRNAVVCLVLAVITLALYNPVNRHPFVNYDDDRYVTENPHIQQGLTTNTITWAITSTEQANWHPLTWMSHALDVTLFRLNPAGHHFTNVALHIANVCLLFLLLMWARKRLGPSLFVAALFALHPINVESVAWIAERKNVLCTFFFFLTLWAYGWYSQKPGWKRYLAVSAAFVAGLASKPMVITLPFVLLLLDYWPLSRGGEEKNNWPKLVLEKLPLLALSGASAILTMNAQQAGGAVRTTTAVSLGARLANAIHAYAMYLWKMIWPADLAPLYPHPGNSLPAWQVAVSAVVLGAITALVWKFRSHRYLPVGWLFFVGTLVPVIGLIQFGEAAMADRYAYIPMIGIFVMIAFGVADLGQQRNLALIPSLAAPAVLFALTFVTHEQIGYWKSSESLWTHALAVTENNFVAEDNLGGALILEGKEEQAHAHFEAAALINPDDPLSHGNLGTYSLSHGLVGEAIQQYQAALKLTSDPILLAQTYANLGAAYRASGDMAKAEDNYNQSLRLNPNQFNAWLGLGMLAQREGKYDESIADLQRSLDFRPNAQAYVALGRSFAHSGRNAEALSAYEHALKINPDLAEAQQALQALQPSSSIPAR